MISRPDEAIVGYDIMYEKSQSDYDRSVSLSLKADSLTMIGKTQEALEHYQKVLNISYYHYNAYLPLVNCYKELNILSTEEWIQLLKKMEKAIELFHSKKFVTEEIEDDLAKSFLYSEGDTGLNILRSDIYWAMFSAADKGLEARTLKYDIVRTCIIEMIGN